MGALVTLQGTRPWRPLALGVAAIAAATGVAVIAAALVLDPPANDLLVLALAIAATGLAGVVATAALLGPLSRLGLAWQLLLLAALSLAILVANVAVASGLMFLSSHDLELLFVLLGYAFAATLAPAYLMARRVSARVETLERAAASIAEGHLDTRVSDLGSDGIGRVAVAFNEMAGALDAARQRQHELEIARRELFTAISHDLRTPLAAMRAMVEALADGVVTDPATVGRYHETMAGEIRQLSGLIDDLFELSTIDSGELRLRFETLRVEQLVAEAVDAFRAQGAQKGVDIAFEPGQTGPILGDPQRLIRVLYNLLQNAMRHTPAEGRIVLRTVPADHAVRVVVSDTGEGIPAEDAPHVFDRFFRGEKSRSREFGGSGLGLSIARGIVEAHGGRIWVEPTDGRGATVAFTIPVAGEPARV